MLPLKKFYFTCLLLLLVHQIKTDHGHKNEKIIVDSLDDDLMKSESLDQPTELDILNKPKIASPTSFFSNKSGSNGAPLGLSSLLKHLPNQPFSSASSTSSIFANPFSAHSPALAKAAALIKPRALGRFPGFLTGAASNAAASQIGPVYTPNVASSNIVLQHNGPHQMYNGPPPPPFMNGPINTNRPNNQINNAPIMNGNLPPPPPISAAENNVIELNDLGAPFFENHMRHNNERDHREHNLPPHNNGPMNNDGPPMDHPQYNNNNNNNNDWSLNNHKQLQVDKPRITHLDVKCEKNLMKVFIEFDKPFNGVIFSKGHFSYPNCVHLQPNTGRNQANFDINVNQCGTSGNTQNGFYGYGASSGSGTFFENTVVVQYDPQVQEAWDTARKLRCTWHDQYEKAVSFRPFPVDMLDVVKADFAGDNVGCWMQIQVGKGPWASEVAGIVKIGQTMTMVLAIKDEENKFDMLVRNCIAHDGERAPIELVDGNGCITRPKLMSRFTKIKNFGNSATVLSYAHFQDSMEVHFQCTIQICRHKCSDQCSKNGGGNDQHSSFVVNGKFENQRGRDPMNGDLSAAASELSESLPEPAGQQGSNQIKPRSERDVSKQLEEIEKEFLKINSIESKEVGLSRVLNVVSKGDLAFTFNQTNQNEFGDDLSLFDSEIIEGSKESLQAFEQSRQFCVSGVYFFGILMTILLSLLITCCGCIIFYLKHRCALRKYKAKDKFGSSSISDLYSVPPYDIRNYRK